MTIAEASFRSLGGILFKPTALPDLSHWISDRTVDSEISVNRKVEFVAFVKDILDERFDAAFIFKVDNRSQALHNGNTL